jgi:cysteinyl-tRNA synthetase
MGFKIETTMNITDIDDKTIKDSIKNDINLRDFTQTYIDFFFEDLAKLNIVKADNVSRISDLIDVMAEIINGLLAK